MVGVGSGEWGVVGVGSGEEGRGKNASLPW